MESVERYFHIRPAGVHGGLPVASRGGATVRVVGDNDVVSVQVALCSAKDMFCRKTGRLTAAKHVSRHVALEELPIVLENVAREVTSKVLKLSRNQRQHHHLWNQDYSFATKYFQPKTDK